MSLVDLEARLRTALTTLILDEYSLLENVRVPFTASDRVIAHQMGWRLRNEFARSWDIDVEYNREGTMPTAPAAEKVRRPVDVSIHHRGMRGSAHNLLVMEVKTAHSGDISAEVARLEQTMDRYSYQHGVILDLGLTMGADPLAPPVEVYPQWLWLPGRGQFSPVFTIDAASQLSTDGWQARQRRYPFDSAGDEEYAGWRSATHHEPEPTAL
ncbi:MAG: hypothetical protein LBG70_05180 [Bifidobacteriaceae bacterium]|jgi:hypothetical protein|nr:hypothetical protein [Bifidobacteriaceae bacterium]